MSCAFAGTIVEFAWHQLSLSCHHFWTALVLSWLPFLCDRLVVSTQV